MNEWRFLLMLFVKFKKKGISKDVIFDALESALNL